MMWPLPEKKLEEPMKLGTRKLSSKPWMTRRTLSLKRKCISNKELWIFRLLENTWLIYLEKSRIKRYLILTWLQTVTSSWVTNLLTLGFDPMSELLLLPCRLVKPSLLRTTFSMLKNTLKENWPIAITLWLRSVSNLTTCQKLKDTSRMEIMNKLPWNCNMCLSLLKNHRLCTIPIKKLQITWLMLKEMSRMGD